MIMPTLELRDVKKIFGKERVLDQLNLKLHKGEILALLGDNGAGKSTLIKIIAGYHPPDGGEIWWCGAQIDQKNFGPQIARKLGIQTVYQHLGLVNQLSISRNFFLGLEPVRRFGPFAWLDQRYMREIVKDQLKEMGIKRALNPDDLVEKLSGGERQVVAISRAKFFGAKLLILDEPTSALSVKQTQQVLDYIVKASEMGITVIFITHTLHHLERIVDKILILHHGKTAGLYNAGDISPKDCARLIVHGVLSENC
jgi:simple sugar transport system ATP-binding protein